MVGTSNFDRLDSSQGTAATNAQASPTSRQHEPDPSPTEDLQPGLSSDYVCLQSDETLIVIEARLGQRPIIVYAGPSLGKVHPDELATLATRQHAPGGANVHLRGSMLNELGTGAAGPAGFVAHRDGKAWAADFRLVEITRSHENSVELNCRDSNTELAAIHHLEIDESTGVLAAQTTIENLGSEPIQVDWCAALCLPVDERLSQLWGFTGRWGSEFQMEEIDNFRGSYLRENKTGRTSHDAFPGLIAAAEASSENNGLAAAFHLGWSGNHRLQLDRGQDNRCVLQMGELLFPGEIVLEHGGRYATPKLLACWSRRGIGSVSRKFHQFTMERVLDGRIARKPRPVHFNTWEAIYFDHSERELLKLAELAASVGAERFVLDDGWFGSRRHDKAGLGDWWVSSEVYPNGLHAIATQVRQLGMEFGLWFEPEMVNPDSDLYRAHPDWILEASGVEAIPFRNQFTLDLTKSDVFDYLFGKITALVEEYSITYIKWDMNRDVNHPGSGDRGAMHRQTLAVYRLIRKLRDAHPVLEIESCSSGGGRVDYGILRHTDRFWTSDNNDARQRHAIQRGASHFFPLAITGSHVGPRHCHSTGRAYPMAFRAGTAIFGHMGMELDLRDECEEDCDILSQAISLHKKFRNLIHSGEFYRGETEDHINLVGCVASDSSEALYSCAQLDAAKTTLSKRIRFPGLDADKQYNLRLVWPPTNPSITSPSIIEAADLFGDGKEFGGAALSEFGLQMPLVFPDTCLIFHLESQTD